MNTDLSKLSLNELLGRYSRMIDKYDTTADDKYWEEAERTRTHLYEYFERKSDKHV